MFQFINYYPLYRLISFIIRPILPYFIERRIRQGKEIASRKQERKGISSIPRPAGKLIWIHAASNGESRACLPLIRLFQQDFPDYTLLLTSGTKSSHQLMAGVLPESVIHQFLPWDTPDWVNNFLNHWRPNLAIMVEQEIWPNLLTQTKQRNIPIMLVNGRISDKSYYHWRMFRATARSILGNFSIGFAMDKIQAQRLHHLGISTISYVGDLKADIIALDYNHEEYKNLEAHLTKRIIWLAASTHAGEEEIILEIDRGLRAQFPNLLTIIAPRHTHRGKDVVNLLQSKKIKYGLRSQQAMPSEYQDIYIVDRFGELGLFFKLARFCFIGGSLIGKIGGHNPMEAAGFACPILMGPDQDNCKENAKLLEKNGGLKTIHNSKDGVKIISQILNDENALSAMRLGLDKSVDKQHTTSLKIMEAIKPVLQKQEA